jgi:ketosteroid isomerase-like protein
MSDPEFSTPEAAEAAFYQAFEAADVPAMLRVWDDAGTVTCIHPMGARIEGRESVGESWRQILGPGPRLKVRITRVRATLAEGIAVHVVDEVVTIVEDGREAIIQSTNVYRRTARGGWRMVLHHASPAPTPRREPAPVFH